MGDLESIMEKLSEFSRIAFCEYIGRPSLEIEEFRFFSYGSNLNECKFRTDTKESGYEFGLEKAEKRTLDNYKRIFGNKSKKHGLAFTICSKSCQVQGICHNIPLKGLTSFLKKEGVLLKEPTYDLIIVSIPGEKHPVLTLRGLKPSNLEKLSCREKLKAYCYVESSILGAKVWNVDYADMQKLKDRLEKEFCE